MKRSVLGLALLASVVASSLQAQTIHTSSFFTPTNTTGFETIGNGMYPLNTDYTDGGITAHYVGQSNNSGLWTGYMYQGNFGWYPNGGANGYSRFTLSGGGAFNAFGFLGGSGTGPLNWQYELMLNGVSVATGVGGVVDGSALQYFGISGITMDEVRLQSQYPDAITFNPNGFESMALDNIEIGSLVTATPEPASVVLLATGLIGVVGVARRKRAQPRA